MVHIPENVSEKDRRQIEQAEEMLGQEPDRMGVIRSYFWGDIREDLLFPYPDEKENARCEELLSRLDDYLRNEHPHFAIDVNQEIPRWAVKRLFDIGVMGMTIPEKYGGGGFGITSYIRALHRIGRTCQSTAVMVSAHQSIGCGAIRLFGTEEQKKRFLPAMASEMLSAFCLSEPNVGSDAAGQETTAVLSEDGRHYILNGEKKWATSGAIAGLFTVMATQEVTDPDTGKQKKLISAFICTPDMEGMDIFSRNRSKCGIRGTWQARIRLTNVKAPKENLLHEEGKGLKVALACLDIGRCTLSAGMLGAAEYAKEQAVKWAQTRHQFGRPIAEFEMIQNKISEMTALCHAMKAMLYMTTGMLERGDEDIMLETAVCKVFCSEMGFRVVDNAMQIMGGEGYMTENVIERLWRDSRINIIVEGANEVMHSFIFGYGAKRLGEHLLEMKENPFRHFGEAVKTGGELFLGLRLPAPKIEGVHAKLAPFCGQLANHVQSLNVDIKRMFLEHMETIIAKQMIQQRLSTAVIWIHALACAVSKMDATLRREKNGDAEEKMKIFAHFAAIAKEEINRALDGLWDNTDETMRQAAKAAMKEVDKLPNGDYVIPEKTPDMEARGTGIQPDQTDIPQFGKGFYKEEE